MSPTIIWHQFVHKSVRDIEDVVEDRIPLLSCTNSDSMWWGP